MQKILTRDSGVWLLTQGSTVHLAQGDLPQGTAAEIGVVGRFGRQIGQWAGKPLWLVAETAENHDDGRAYFSLRDQLVLPSSQFNLLCRGVEINHFWHTHRFCGKCGSPTHSVAEELAVQCGNADCNQRFYPVICPSIIVAVRRGRQILLANHQRHKGGIYTTLAGFVESGETFEQAVEREVWEETGIRVKNIRYVGSQPWAFPNSQMVGFLADYDSGELRLQESEIHAAAWFDYDRPLPPLPPTGTIALALINATLALCAESEK